MDIRGAGRAVPESVRERMGSGGPRGLQILRSDVESVRGGFDSHAFPPPRARRRAALLLIGLLLAGGAGAVESGAPDSSRVGTALAPGGRDSSAASAAPAPAAPRPRSARADSARAPVRRGRFNAPNWVMLRSLAFPAWGQLHNRAWLKATLLGGGEVALLVGLLQDDRRLSDLRSEADRARVAGDVESLNAAVDAYNSRLDRFVSRQWLLGGVLVYAMVDAYVDAQFRDFKVEFEYDPAAPGGRPPAGGARLSLRWSF